ncbi:MAG: metallophosphoesterase [Chitinophagales bacterium]
MRREISIWFKLGLFAIFILLDWYIFQAVKTSFASAKPSTQKIAYGVYFGLSLFPYIAFAVLLTVGYFNWHGWSKNIIVGVAQAVFISKVLVLPFLLIDDIIRLFSWIGHQFSATKSAEVVTNTGISRLQFLSKAALAVGAVSFGSFIYGIVRGAYNYKKARIKLPIPNLPDEFKDLKIIQISDLHIGSFASASPVHKIVDLINEENPDIVFFTGDLVNYTVDEALPHASILKTIKAKKAVYSILGNHDYGMYVDWSSQEDHQKHFQQLLDLQKELGWDLLMDENRIIEINHKKLAIIGVQYIGHNLRFGKFGNLDKAYQGAENADVQLLLSHDPSHWDHEVSQKEQYKNIHATFAGHTHGFQFGIEIPKIGLKWSPSQYVYPHWAGLYKKDQQHLYVNRGAGFLGYPGRLGISPEITIFQLVKA